MASHAFQATGFLPWRRPCWPLVLLLPFLLAPLAALEAEAPDQRGEPQGDELAKLRPSDTELLEALKHSRAEADEAGGAATAEGEDSEHEMGEQSEGSERREGAGAAEEEEAVDPVTLTVGIMVFAFLFINMVILHCINYPDPNIRSYVYRMMSSTISVFLAVTTNEAVNSMITEQILAAPPPRGLGIQVTWTHKVVVGAALLLFWYGCLNLGAFKLRLIRGRGYVFALKVIGGHVTAFAGITFFGLLQEANVFSKSLGMSVLALIITLVIMSLLRRGSHNVRMFMHRRSLPADLQSHFADAHPTFTLLQVSEGSHGQKDPIKDETVAALPVGMAHEQSYNVEEDPSFIEWGDEVSEAEDDSMALILSFLIRQIALFAIIGKPVPWSTVTADSIPTSIQNTELLLVSAGALVSVALFTTLLMYQKKVHMKASNSLKQARMAVNSILDFVFQAHFTNTIQSTFAMTSSLCLCRLAEWMARGYVKDFAMCTVVAAVALTFCVLVAIVGLDKIADTLVSPEAEALDAEEEKPLRKSLHVSPTRSCASSRFGPPMMPRMGVEDDMRCLQAVDTGSVHSATETDAILGILTAAREPEQHHLIPVDPTSKHFSDQLKEFTLRRIIEGLGLAVGISWEKAFHVSEEILIEGIPMTARHKVISKIIFAFVLIAVIFPAWLWYLVPKARMHWKDFRKDIERSKEAMSGVQTTE